MMAHPIWKNIRDSPTTSIIRMDEVQALVFGEDDKWYQGTEALNSCFAVWVLCPLASVGAHIPPHPGPHDKDPAAGDKNLVKKMRELAEKYNQKKHVFEAGTKTVLVYARIEGKSPLPDKKAFIEKCLKQFGVDIAMQAYDIKLIGEPRDDCHGTAFVYATPEEGAYFFLEDKLCLRIFHKSTTSETQSKLKPVSTSTPQESAPGIQRDLIYSATPTSATSYVSNPIFPQVSAPGTQPALISSATPTSASSPRELVTGSQRALMSSTTKSSQSLPNTAQKPAARPPFKDLRYVKSQPSSKEKGARLVHTDRGLLNIQASLWKREKDEVSKTEEFWVCKKYKLYTDL
ncbi:uncharacterized protein PV07_12568 [Cladophialophora immunda]|uniref:Uncharacterized protein n=1 Tax=Cladophialophora immunda TaxID=569365 RepID=A0A0D2BSN6_9EURO|nr:uncharacterized protein PV07_12568 [Cladophialophora immunda]KIW22028.1 hypothetical protein PV07_12568 [Cladophialophora immunda]